MTVPQLTRKLMLSLIVLAAAGTAIAGATWSSFSHTTANPSNGFSAGTVNIAGDDGGAAFSLSNMSPGTNATGCIRVTYSGSLASTVHLYANVTGTLAQYLDLTVTRGSESSPSFPSCTSFTPDPADYLGAGAGVVYSGTLGAFASAHSNFANGLADAPGSPQTWNTNDSHSYKLSVTLPGTAPAAAQGLSSNATFDWEAQNQ
jgi:hypothetical protein